MRVPSMKTNGNRGVPSLVNTADGVTVSSQLLSNKLYNVITYKNSDDVLTAGRCVMKREDGGTSA